MTLIVQIYEIQTPEEAEAMTALGVDHIGSVMLPDMNWETGTLRDTIKTTQQSGAKSSLIPLFSDQDQIFRSLDYFQPDIVHFCEDLLDARRLNKLVELQENVKKKFPEISIMRSIPITQPGLADIVDSIGLAKKFEPLSDYFLTDTLLIGNNPSLKDQQPVSGFVGITGKTCDWDLALELVRSSRIPVILAGGISPENVSDGIGKVHPAGVDSCTATNAVARDGRPIRFKKDKDKVKRFVELVRECESGMKAL